MTPREFQILGERADVWLQQANAGVCFFPPRKFLAPERTEEEVGIRGLICRFRGAVILLAALLQIALK